MKESWDKILTYIMYGSMGAFFVHAFMIWIDYVRFPIKYDVNSAPWYMTILLEAYVVLIVVTICYILKRIMKKNNERQ